jgi:hypothetical protein
MDSAQQQYKMRTTLPSFLSSKSRAAAQIYRIPLGFGVFWGGVFWRIGRLNLMRLTLC